MGEIKISDKDGYSAVINTPMEMPELTDAEREEFRMVLMPLIRSTVVDCIRWLEISRGRKEAVK
jgi:hypothetical protein